jgi:hypothetical protein
MVPALTLGTDTVTWRPVAKDGADLPPNQALSRTATGFLEVGETADFEFSPSRRGAYTLSFRRPAKLPPLTQRIVVR